jgi:hypothetical protein
MFLLRQLAALWSTFDEWYDGDLVAARAARSATLVESAQRSVRTQTQSYMRFVYQQYDDLEFPSAEEIDAQNDQLIERAVIPLDEWNRPAEQFRFERSIGKSEEEALQVALQRVEDLGDLDMQLAMRKEAHNIFAASKITGYRRVLHPELAESKQSCGLCIAASTRIYKKKELLPIHDHCHCGVMPIVGDEDPGNFFNETDLQGLYELAGGETSAQALSRVRYKIDEHGELGPYLVEEGSTVKRSAGRRTPKAAKITRQQSVEAQIRSLNASLPRLVDRRRSGEDVNEAIQWQQERLRILNAESAEMARRRR